MVRRFNEGFEEWLKSTEKLTVYEGHARFEDTHQVRVGDGSEVTIIEMGPRLIQREDEDISEAIREILESESLNIRLNAKCIAVEKHGDKIAINLDCSAEERRSHVERRKAMGATTVRDQSLSEEMIDATLADSFPASDPPSWTLGRDTYQEKEPATAIIETAKTNSKEESTMKPNIDLSDEQRDGVVKILNLVLSDEYLLYTKTRNYHWNVVGPEFNDLHKFFEEQYTELNEVVDDVAERARSVGGSAFGTLAEFSPAHQAEGTSGSISQCPGDDCQPFS